MTRPSFRDLINEKIGDDLSAIGARFLEETMVDNRQKDVCFFAVDNITFEIEDSYHDGLDCRIEGGSDTGDRDDFASWARLFELNSLKSGLSLDEQIRRNLPPGEREQRWRYLGRALRLFFITERRAD